MEEAFWVIIVIVLFIALIKKDKEFLSKISKEERKKILNERKIAQEKMNKEWLKVAKWLGIGIIIFLCLIFFIILNKG